MILKSISKWAFFFSIFINLGTTYAQSNSCFRFFSGQSFHLAVEVLAPTLPVVDTHQRRLEIAEFAKQTLSALDKTSNLATDYFETSRDSLLRINNISSSQQYKDYVADLIADKGAQQQVLNRTLDIFQSRIFDLNKKIPELFDKQAQTVSRKEKTSLDEAVYSQLKEINDLFDGAKLDLETLSKETSYLDELNTKLNEAYRKILELEVQHIQYAEDVKHFQSALLLGQVSYPNAIPKIASTSHLYSSMRMQADAMVAQVSALKQGVEIRAVATTFALESIKTQSTLLLPILFTQHGFTPNAAKELLAKYANEVQQRQNANIQELKQKSERRSWWANFRQKIVVAGAALSIVGGGYTLYDKNAIKSDEFAETYSLARGEMYQSSNTQKSMMSKYRLKAAPKLVEVVELSKSGVAVTDHLANNFSKKSSVSPETILYLLSYSPELIKELKYNRSLYTKFFEIVDPPIKASLTRDFTPEERQDLAIVMANLKSTFEPFYKRLAKFNFSQEQIGESRTTFHTAVDQRLSYLLTAFESQKIVKDKNLAEQAQEKEREIQNQKAAELQAQQAEATRVQQERAKAEQQQVLQKLIAAKLIDVKDPAQIELLAEKRVTPELALIFQSADQKSALVLLKDYTSKNSLSNADALYALKKISGMSSMIAVNDPINEEYLKGVKPTSSLAKKIDKNMKEQKPTEGSTDSRFAAIFYVLSKTNFEPMNQHEASLLRSYIDNPNLYADAWEANFLAKVRGSLAAILLEKIKVIKK